MNSNDNFLCDVIMDESKTSFEKGKILLDEENLSELVITTLINNSNKFDQYVIELIFTTQEKINDPLLISLINRPDILDGTLKSILLANAPLSQNLKTEISTKRSNINLSEIDNQNKYERLISVCENTIYYAKKIYVIENCDATTFVLEDCVARTIFNNSTDLNKEKMFSSEGGGWTRGSAKVTDKGDGIVRVQCSRPPYPKCCKVIQPKLEQLSTSEQGL